jgi:hypothetical protein
MKGEKCTRHEAVSLRVSQRTRTYADWPDEASPLPQQNHVVLSSTSKMVLPFSS